MGNLSAKEVLDDIWHRGLDGTNVREFEKAREAIGMLIDAANGLSGKATKDGFIFGFNSIEDLTTALILVNGDSE